MIRPAWLWLVVTIAVASGCGSVAKCPQFGGGTWEISRGVLGDTVAWVSVNEATGVETWLVQAGEAFPLQGLLHARFDKLDEESPADLCQQHCDDVDDNGAPQIYEVTETHAAGTCNDMLDLNEVIVWCGRSYLGATVAYGAFGRVQQTGDGWNEMHEIWAVRRPTGEDPPEFPFDFSVRFVSQETQQGRLCDLFSNDLGEPPAVHLVTARWRAPTNCPPDTCPMLGGR